MKITLKMFASITVMLTALLAGPRGGWDAQAQSAFNPASASVVAVSSMPTTGIFCSMSGKFPPGPFNPFPQLNLYTDGTPGCYYYDDSDFDYAAYWAEASRSGSGGMTMDGPPAPPGGFGGTNGSSGGGTPESPPFIPPTNGYVPCETWTNFWLEISRSSNVIEITISNTLPGMSYQLREKTNLTQSSWTFIQTLTATGTTVATNVNAGTNATLFFAASLTTNDQPPVITEPPSNQVVGLGSNAVFNVTATGLAPLSYQWQHDGTNLPDATTSTLAIGSVQTNNAGAYTVIVSNVICTASAEAGLGLTWVTSLSVGIDASPAIGPDGTIYIANTANTFFALDPVSGGIKWSNALGSGSASDITSSAAVSANGSAVYVGSFDGYLYAFNPANGAVLWSNYLGGSVYSSPAIGNDGTVYVATYNSSSNGLFAVNPFSTNIDWFFETDDAFNGVGQSIDSSPAVGPNCSIYFLDGFGDLYAVSPNGTLQWFFPLPTAHTPSSSPAIGDDGTIYVGSGDGYLYAVSPDGTLQWIFDTADGAAINSSPAIGGDGTVYIASTDGNLYAITNGILKWAFTNAPYYPFVSSPAVSADGTVYIGAEDNNVYAITNGAVKWTYATGQPVISSPAINPADGGIIIASEDGNVYKLPGSGSLAANAPWPMFHQNVRHAGAAPNPACSGGGVTSAFPNNPYFQSGSAPFSFLVSGTPGSYWDIFASSNLTTWDEIGNVLLSSDVGDGYFDDYSVAGITNRFYQLRAGNFCSQVIGFVIVTLGPQSTNLIANQFYQVNDYEYPQNTALGLFEFLSYSGFPYPPDQTQIMKWNGVGFDEYTFSAVYEQWLPNGDSTLLPGEAAFFINPSSSSVSVPFGGLVLQGVSSNEIVAGTNYVSSIVPAAGRITSDLNYIPHNGDAVQLWTGSSFSSYTYSGGWSPSEPVVGVGQGFVLVASQTNSWVTNLAVCQTGSILVTANPLWTDSGYSVSNGDTVYFPASGIWNGGQGNVGVGGESDSLGWECFLTNTVAPHDSLIAFVGPNPYCDTNGANRWGDPSYFPQPPGEGYWEVGTTNQFTTDRAGELWFGFNDDAVLEDTGDNSGFVVGQLQITGP